VKAAIYVRVSKDQQHTDNQLPELYAYAKRAGWEVVEYVEKASGKEGSKRPVLAQLLKDAELKKFHAVIVWKIDRFGRSLSDFVGNVRKLDTLNIRFVAPNQGIDTDQRSPFSKLLMHLLAIFAEFERDLIVERVNAGLIEYRRLYDAGKIGKSRNSKSGKNLPQGRPRKIFRRDVAAKMRAEGESWRDIAKALNVSQSTIRASFKK
jgi:putative DNA-invertase from lambdoid prophage Rac